MGISVIFFDFGFGYVMVNVLDLGLVYDMVIKDYVNFLCVIGYLVDIIVRFIVNVVICLNFRVEIEDMNYFLFFVVFKLCMFL